jgi:site-specific DNA-adenine methylase
MASRVQSNYESIEVRWLMMEIVDEYEVIQNCALGALALWTFAAEYYLKSDEKYGPNLAVAMLVLPLVYNEHFVNSVFRRNLKGGFYNALNDDKALFLGVQDRMQSMATLTLKSINICFSAKLLTYDKDNSELLPIRTNTPAYKDNDSIKDILSASKRLGYWFSTLNFQELCALLKVRY